MDTSEPFRIPCGFCRREAYFTGALNSTELSKEVVFVEEACRCGQGLATEGLPGAIVSLSQYDNAAMAHDADKVIVL